MFFGLCSFLFVEMLKYFKHVGQSIKMSMPYKSILGGSFLAILTLLVSTRYLGLGLETIQGALEGRETPKWDFLLKMFFTSVTLNFGGTGGIVTPIFYVGATSGNAFGSLFGLDPAMFAAIGMVSVLAGAANTPISASIMAIELFGPAIGPYAAVSCVISFLLTGHRSVYPSQILSMRKSSSIEVGKGQVMEDLEDIALKPRSGSIIGGIIKGIEKIKGKQDMSK